MFKGFTLPPAGFGPGSQPTAADGDVGYMPMPQDMRTFAAHLPEIADPDGLAPALALIADLGAACARVAGGGGAESFDLAGLDRPNRRLVAETLGEGEVAMRLFGRPAVAV